MARQPPQRERLYHVMPWAHSHHTCNRCGIVVRRGGTNNHVPAREYLCRDCKDVLRDLGELPIPRMQAC